MSIYRELLINPPKLTIKKDAREAIFNTVSCMCDNKYDIRFKKNSEGDFKMSGGGFSLSNYSFNHEVSEIEWEADDQNWDIVIKMMNEGNIKVSDVRSR